MPATTRRRKRTKVQSTYKVKVISETGRSWIEERCWKCKKTLQKHPPYRLSIKREQMQCPSCRAVNIVEVEA